jgi:hypothetical protein
MREKLPADAPDAYLDLNLTPLHTLKSSFSFFILQKQAADSHYSTRYVHITSTSIF